MAAIAAPVAAVPTVVTISAGPPHPRSNLVLPANDPLVLAYPCLEWIFQPAVGATPATASIPTFIAVRMWMARHTIGTSQASVAQAGVVSVFTAAYNGQAWSRWLTELTTSGLLDKGPFDQMRDSDAALAALVIKNLDLVAIDYGDFLAVEPFDAPAVAAVAAVAAGRGRGAGRARGRGVPAIPAVAAVAVVAGPASLRFINMCSLARLFDENNLCPFMAYCLLAGAIGPACTQMVRADPFSTAQALAPVLRPFVASTIGIDTAAAAMPANDAPLAVAIPGAIESAFQFLSSALAIDKPTETGLLMEARDALVFANGNEAQRFLVITRRLPYIGDRRVSLSAPACSASLEQGIARASPLAHALGTCR